MEEIIDSLQKELAHKKRMIGTTAYSWWFDLGLTQEEWDRKEIQRCKNLENAIEILMNHSKSFINI